MGQASGQTDGHPIVTYNPLRILRGQREYTEIMMMMMMIESESEKALTNLDVGDGVDLAVTHGGHGQTERLLSVSCVTRKHTNTRTRRNILSDLLYFHLTTFPFPRDC